MPRIRETNDNLFDLPPRSVVCKNNSVYVNLDNVRVEPGNGKKPYTGHNRVCIGKLRLNEDGSRSRQMYGNQRYYQLFRAEELPLPPERADCLSVGLKIFIEEISKEFGLIEILREVFGDEDSNLILDLSMYMLTKGSAVFQHYPDWARDNFLFSKQVRSDSYISNFLKDSVTYSKIRLFLTKWAKKHIDNGNVYLCYDSTNVNSQAKGIYIVQKGHAKDDPDLPQLNSDYIIRQEDGLPLLFTEFPGSIVDICEAKEIISFLGNIKDNNKITITCDRGYISEKNLIELKNNNISYLMLLKNNLLDYNFVLNNYYEKLKNNYSYYIEDLDCYGLTVERKIFGNGDINYFHLIYDRKVEDKHTKNLHDSIKNRKKFLEMSINRKKLFYSDEIKRLAEWHDIETIDAGTIIVNKRGRGGAEQVVPAYCIISFTDNIQKIKASLDKCGFYILVSSDQISARDARIAYSKRDCVEKVFQVLKSSLGMDKIGVHSENNLHSKSLIWFISSIIHSIIFKKIENLRMIDNKNFTFQSVVNKLYAIKADKDLNLNIYKRRYALDSKQKKIMDICSINEKMIDDNIQSLTSL